MNRALFCVTCMVDNGCTHERHETYLFAFTNSQAKYNALNYWNQQYDTTAKIESVRTVNDSIGNIICTKRI